jgi:ferric-dicitrate binding protein FerR (iron transport regulator)
MDKRIKYLFRKYLLNTCSVEELNEFFDCIRRSDHDESLRQILQETFESIQMGSDTYVNQSGDLIIPGTEHPFILPEKKRKPSRRPAAVFAFVLTVLAITGSFFTNFHFHPIDSSYQAGLKKTSTERAEYKYILLPDSTQVWLNAGSTLEYPDHFDQGTREVTLSGEAYFDVKHAAEHPFIIHTGQILTTVLGTAFNINAYADRSNIKVSVSRGKVKVSRGNQQLALLLKNQEIKVSQKETEKPQKVSSTNSIAEWQQGNMVYDDEKMGEIIADLQRVYNVNIRLMNMNMMNVQVTTRFRRELGIGQALEILCKLTDTQISEKKGTYFIQ